MAGLGKGSWHYKYISRPRLSMTMASGRHLLWITIVIHLLKCLAVLASE